MKTAVVTKNKKARARGKRKPRVQPKVRAISSKELRELHSKAMEPQLKTIRDKLTALSLQKTRPKQKKPKKKAVDKENISNSGVSTLKCKKGC